MSTLKNIPTKKKYALQHHIDLDFLGKPALYPSDFEVNDFLDKDGLLVSAEWAAQTLVMKSHFLKHCIIPDYIPGDHDEDDPFSEINQHIFIYIHILGIYGFLKRTSLVYMLTKLFLDLKLDKIIKEKSDIESILDLDLDKKIHIESRARYNSDFLNLRSINNYLKKPAKNYSYIYNYAYEIAYELDDSNTIGEKYKYIDTHLYRFRNSVQKHAHFDENYDPYAFGSFYYFNMDYSDDLTLLDPHHYETIYINTQGYFYMPDDMSTDEDSQQIFITL